MATLYCKNRDNKTVPVWNIIYNVDNGKTEMHKYKPHLMGSKADIGFNGYATQQICFVKIKKDKTTKEYDMVNQFKKHPDTRIIIDDKDTGKVYESYGRDWMQYGRVANYGDGKQIFLDIKFMVKIKDNRFLS